jgi:hypothetical protein
VNSFIGENFARQTVIIEMDQRQYLALQKIAVALYPMYYNEKHDPETEVQLSPLGLLLSALDRPADEVRSIVHRLLLERHTDTVTTTTIEQHDQSTS